LILFGTSAKGSRDEDYLIGWTTEDWEESDVGERGMGNDGLDRTIGVFALADDTGHWPGRRGNRMPRSVA